MSLASLVAEATGVWWEMEPEAWFEAMAVAEISLLRQLADAIAASSEVEVLEAPTEALVHVRARDSVQSGAFFLGEALFTRCRVRIDGVQGFGACLGGDAERALCMAILDTALRAGHPLAGTISKALDAHSEESAKKGRLTASLVQRTRVRFEF